MLCSDLWRYACHKNSSYLIEKALCYCDADRIVRELGDPEADVAIEPV